MRRKGFEPSQPLRRTAFALNPQPHSFDQALTPPQDSITTSGIIGLFGFLQLLYKFIKVLIKNIYRFAYDFLAT